MVVASHYGDLSNSNSSIVRALYDLKRSCWIGVEIFFVLSGFLITGIIYEKRLEIHRFRNFYSRRALRLFPVFYGVWALLLVYLAVSHQPWNSQYFAYLFYCGNMVSLGTVGPFLIRHFWSLAVEEQFYLIWPIALWKLRDKRRAIQILIVAAVFSIVLKPILIMIHNGQWGYFLLPSHMEGLALGSLLALTTETARARRVLAVASRMLPVLLVIIVVLMLYFRGLSNEDPRVVALTVPLVSLASMSLIQNATTSGSLCARIMNLRFLRFYGRYSYGLYVYHFLVRGVLRKAISGVAA